MSGGPLAEIRYSLEETVSQAGLAPADRIYKLRAMREELTALLGVTDTYIADVELVREAQYLEDAEAVRFVRENADIRERLIEANVATAEELDALGYLSHAELDRLREEGRLIEAIGVIRKWLERLHPRGRGGRFRDKPGVLPDLKGRGGGKSALQPAKPKPAQPKPAQPRSSKKPRYSPSRIAAAKAELRRARPRSGAPSDEEAVRWIESKEKVASKETKAASRKSSSEKSPLKKEIEGDWIDVDDIDEAIELLGEGKKVRLQQPRQVSTLIDKLHKITQEMREKGEDAPNYDLCRVSVRNTNLFCKDSKGIDRLNMPQFSGVPIAGMPADDEPKDDKGKVNLSAKFAEHLRSKGVNVEPDTELASFLRASQRQLIGAKVAGIAGRIKSGKDTAPDERLFVSRDNYVVDGHHRWAAKIALDYEDGKGDLAMNIERIDMDILDVLDEANAFVREQGLPAKAPVEPPTMSVEPPYEPILEHPNVPELFDVSFEEGESDEEIRKNLAIVEQIGLNDWPSKGEVAAALLGAHKDTEAKFTVLVPGDPKPKRVYSDPARLEFHEKVLDMLLRQRKLDKKGRPTIIDPEGEPIKPPEGKPRVVFMGGGTASGKSTALELEANRDVIPENVVVIDPDEIKAMIPEYQAMIEGGDRYAASGVHEESSYLAKQLQRRAMALGLNVLVDGTADSQIDPDSQGKLAKKIEAFHEHRSDAVPEGYDVSMFYVNAPTEIALVRATKRAMEQGRWVPKPEIENIHRGVSQRFETEVLDLIDRGVISDLRGYQTEGEVPTKMFHLDDEGRFVVLDDALYEAFIAKGSTEG